MDGTTDPYAPGAGARPPALVGRDAIAFTVPWMAAFIDRQPV
ncbi:hypothetical protein CMsap09_03385 [Clavibacter michiganensis]|uniref:Uncharacterized protein n=1 Tax=Clavibacter michiganensis TaxID=28447 RepID=A0A251XS41_9MICO|nr:hypothetical protein CMsap09_03385 [Clavibacter michiganensis]